MNTADNRLTLSIGKTVVVLSGIAIVLIVASIAGQVVIKYFRPRHFYQFIDFFYVDSEQNLPTFFSSFMLMLSALMLTSIAVLKRQHKERYAYHWAVLAFGFFCMSMDEILSVHEKFIYPMQMLLGGGDLGVLEFAWVVPGMALVALVGVFYFTFLLDLPVDTRRMFLLSGSIYIGGAIGMELAGGWYFDQHGLEGLHHPTFKVMATVEETLEMAGIIIFIHAVMTYFRNVYGNVIVSINSTTLGDTHRGPDRNAVV